MHLPPGASRKKPRSRFALPLSQNIEKMRDLSLALFELFLKIKDAAHPFEVYAQVLGQMLNMAQPRHITE